MASQGVKLGTSSHLRGKTCHYKAVGTFNYNGKPVPNWQEISEAEFMQLWDGTTTVEDLSTF